MSRDNFNKNKMIEFLYSVGLFGFGFFVTLHDLPRIPLLGFDVRIGILFFPLILCGLFCVKKNNFFESLKQNYLIWITAFALLTYCALNAALVNPTMRGFGFLLWLIINVSVFFLIVLKPSKALVNGFLFTLVLNSGTILIQHYFYDLIWIPSKLSDFIFITDLVRVYGLFGEPSYAGLNLSFLYLFLIFYDFSNYKKLNILLKAAVVLALFFTYSRTSLIVLLILFPLDFYLCFKKSFKKALVTSSLFIGSFLISAINSSDFYPYMNIKIEKLVRVNASEYFKAQRNFNPPNEGLPESLLFAEYGSQNSRILALQRGWVVFRQNSLFGVGLGNSKKYIFENKILPHRFIEFFGLNNLFIEILAELGLAGMSVFLFFVGSIFYKGIKTGAVVPVGMMFFILFVLMQVFQNINMPAMWMSFYFVLVSCSPSNTYKKSF